ncbi:hypothetical protein [Phenylobacterium sp. SCN 70-31]|uniref:hypothetical protein n=1 Tax=Phenylobacterium sp. SCN 70-31 TaxID=1660129 RepID=UPI0025FCA4F8|nr:hypothetical protein [Phenylobacterium sp. SCN 70-31]
MSITVTRSYQMTPLADSFRSLANSASFVPLSAMFKSADIPEPKIYQKFPLTFCAIYQTSERVFELQDWVLQNDPNAKIEKNSVEIDDISGATFTFVDPIAATKFKLFFC